ncbi:MAG: hypothetical protein VW646_05985 [Hydrogenophilales bacterium]
MKQISFDIETELEIKERWIKFHEDKRLYKKDLPIILYDKKYKLKNIKITREKENNEQ